MRLLNRLRRFFLLGADIRGNVEERRSKSNSTTLAYPECFRRALPSRAELHKDKIDATVVVRASKRQHISRGHVFVCFFVILNRFKYYVMRGVPNHRDIGDKIFERRGTSKFSCCYK